MSPVRTASSAWASENLLAQRAATEGGRIALHAPAPLNVQAKESARDIVTATDLEIERACMQILAGSPYPILSEENIADSQYSMLATSPTWVIDPIDGTANFANSLEYYGISIGLCLGLDFPVGAVHFPRLDRLYATQEGQAMLNGQPVSHQHKALSQSLVGASFSGAFHDASHRERQYALFGNVNDNTRGCMRLGSTAANICFTACGRLQAAYGLRIKIWDIAGSMAVAIAAGCDAIVAPCGDQFSVDYIVGSRDAVAMIHALCLEQGLMAPTCHSWKS